MEFTDSEDFALKELFQLDYELMEDLEKSSDDGDRAPAEPNCRMQPQSDDSLLDDSELTFIELNCNAKRESTDSLSVNGEDEQESADTEYSMQLQSNDSLEIVEEISVTQGSMRYNSNYFYLLDMFPNVDATYIREICIKPPFDKIDGDLLNMLINHLLGYNDESNQSFGNDMHVDEGEVHQNDLMKTEILAKLIEEEEKMNESVMNDRVLSEMLEIQEIEAMEQQEKNEASLNEQLFCEFLEEDQELVEQKAKIIEKILPDIDPHYLRQFIKENHENSESLEEFVDSKILIKDYKKRGEHFAEKQKMENIRRYVTCFDLKEFIRLFPEPFEHFENKKRKCAKNQKAIDFLLKRYLSYPRQYVENAYTSNNYNLSLADKQLQNIPENKPTIQLNIELDEVPLLQEIAFIQNKILIGDYLKKEEREMEILRAQEFLLECQCCCNEIKPTDCIECESDHVFCKNCIIKGADLAISNGQPYVYCFQGSCKNEFTLSIMRQVLPQKTFDTFLRKRQELEVLNAEVKDLHTCPFCVYQAIVPPEVKLFLCENPECMKITCRECKKLNHLPIKCKDVLDEHKSRLYIEEELSDVIIRRCYKCNTPFVKLDGCNKMTCVKCGAVMCYICKKPITDYNHFERGTSCQTHQNSDLFDQEQVQLKRAEATSKIKRDFPDLKIPDI